MTTVAGGANPVQFTNPPVRAVYLTVRFEPIVGLQVTHLASFRQALRDEFPSTAEMPPLQPRNRGGEETKLVPIDRSWPFPWVMYSTADDVQAIAFQNDRFERSWAFSNDTSYPGFEELYASLSEQFDLFATTVRGETDQELRIVGCEAWYSNDLPDLPDSELVVGVASKWQGDSSGANLRSKHATALFHLCDDDELEGCSINLSVDRDADGARLAIDVRYTLPDDGDRSTLELGGLRHAHDHVINTFTSFTSDDMRQQWGQQ